MITIIVIDILTSKTVDIGTNIYIQNIDNPQPYSRNASTNTNNNNNNDNDNHNHHNNKDKYWIGIWKKTFVTHGQMELLSLG